MEDSASTSRCVAQRGDDPGKVTQEMEVPVLADRSAEEQRALARREPSNGTRALVLAGADAGRKFVLGEAAVIGRAENATVQLRDSLVSRTHARIVRRPEGRVVEDLGSRHGTWVNGQRIARARVDYGDQIRVGGTVLLLAHRDPLEEKLLEREQLEILGRLGAGMVHDMNNLLAISLASAGWLASFLEDPTPSPSDLLEARACVASITTATARGQELNAQLLRLAKRQRLESEEIDLSALVGEAVELARRTFHRRIEVEREIVPDVRVVGVRSNLHRVIVNLLLNARDAMPQGGVLAITLHPELDPSAAGGAGSSERVARLRVRDAGVGMDEETRARIFEPLFTSKASGTGLGLATVATVITELGGQIRCTSALGRGTTFEITLPQSNAGARDMIASTNPPAGAGR